MKPPWLGFPEIVAQTQAQLGNSLFFVELTTKGHTAPCSCTRAAWLQLTQNLIDHFAVTE